MPRTPAMMTGIVIGYNSTGSSTSRLRARTSIAANSVPTDANPMVPVTSSAASSTGRCSSAASNSSATSGTSISSGQQQHGQHGQQLADVDGGARRRGQQQRAQRVGVALALERAAQGERAGKGDGHPQDPRCRVGDDPAFLDQRDRKDDHRRQREEQRRRERLAAPDLDGHVLPEHRPDRTRKHRRQDSRDSAAR